MHSRFVRFGSFGAVAASFAIGAWGMPVFADAPRVKITPVGSGPVEELRVLPPPSASASASPAISASAATSAAPATSTVPSYPAVSIAAGRCLEQLPQSFLVRSNWFNHGAAGTAQFQQSLRFRTEKYGYFRGFGRPEWNAHPPGHYAVEAKFFGLPISINKRVVPALACAEAALVASGAAAKYKPRGIGGIRFHNTYHGGEVSNHVYGIAMDMDSEENTCCGCVGRWAKHPLCSKKVASVYERTKVPPIWVSVMERYGWYWLGNDVLQDTMHFEFLGDPDKIVASSPAPASSGASAAR